MFAKNDNKFAPKEKVIHIAFGCGCVRSIFEGKQVVMPRCPVHGDRQISFTEELVPAA